MSFGASLSDIIIVVTFCKALYRECEDAGGGYEEISSEVRALHTVLKHLNYEVEAPDSPLNHDHQLWDGKLAPIVQDCNSTLHQLDGLLQKSGRLLSHNSGTGKVRPGSKEMDMLGAIRVKLINHNTSLTKLLDKIQLEHSDGPVPPLDIDDAQLEIILDKVDAIAERMGKRSKIGYGEDDREVWKQFRKELVAEGFSSEVLEQHKDVLRAYIREMDQEGILNGGLLASASPVSQVKSINSQPQLSAKAANLVSSGDYPPSFSSLGTHSLDSGAKEMMFHEENMKFPPSMKFERPKPESRRDNGNRDSRPNPNLPPQPQINRASTNTSTVPKVITSPDEQDEKDTEYMNTSGSSSDESTSSSSRKRRTQRSKSPQMGLVIRTKDLFAPSHALQLLPPGSPSSYRSNHSYGSFSEDALMHRPKNSVEFSTSPSRPGAISIPHSGADRFATSPNKSTILDPIPRLAPDEFGNEIPPDAKWTKIDRRLVSPEVLAQDRRRYEAHPDFVAVLGVLSRAEIASLAARSTSIREARRRRGTAPSQQSQSPTVKSGQPPPKSPRPIPMPIPHHRHVRDTPSDSDSDDGDGRRRRGGKGYAASDSVPRSGYPNPLGKPADWRPPSLLGSPTSAGAKERGGGGGSYTHQSGEFMVGSPSSRSKDRERERDRTESRRSGDSRSEHRNRDRERERERFKEKQQKKNRWKENLTAGAFGGAAVKLLDVLSEAADGF